MYDLIIIGGGTSGVTAGIYAARKKIKTALVTKDFGGQIAETGYVENWPGEQSILGVDLAKKWEDHMKKYNDVDIVEGDGVMKVDKKADQPYPVYTVTTTSGKKLDTKTLIVATGSTPRKLNIPGEKEYERKGVTYCSICDAPLFKDKVVAVIGGGNAGFDTAIDLLAYAAKIFILEYNPTFRGDEATKEKLTASGKVEFIANAQTASVKGEGFVTGITYKDRVTNEDKTLDVQGVFVAIGLVPDAEFMNNLVNLDERKYIVIDHKTNETSAPGIFAAGDITDIPFKQAVVSAGDGCNALLSAYEYLKKIK